MKKLLKLATPDKRKTIEVASKLKINNKLSEKEIKQFIKSLGTNIEFYEIPSSKTLNPTENRKILIIYFYLKKEHQLKFILREFYKLFDKKTICLFLIFKDQNECGFISFDMQVLNNDLIKQIFKKYTFTSKKIIPNNLKTCLEFENINNNSVIEMFEDLCKKTIYFLDNNKKLEHYLDWDYFYTKKEENDLVKNLKNYKNKLKNTFNNQEKIRLNREIAKINLMLKECRKKITRTKT